MTPERWQQIDKVLQAALERPPSQRADFLDETCAGDEALRKEVESLIGFHERARSFMEAPALEGAADALAGGETDSMTGRTIGPYKILREIAHGGMGEVYLAEDTGPLSRKVALKLLPPQFTMEEDRVRRFQREAIAASGLNHPNIITVYEIGQAGGTHFIAMEFVDGKTLRQQIERTLMKLGEVLDIGIQVAEALTAAHAAGIVHRDIKPENIMVRPDGYVKVLDFGIAKLGERQLATNDSTRSGGDTEPGSVMGTAAYMSPEQVRGEALDARTDLFSFGAVLYEMATARQAFLGASAPLIYEAILNRAPPALHLNAELPAVLVRIIDKALEKERKLRYQTASDLRADLQRLKRDLESQRGDAPSATPPEAINSLAVLPLANASGDPETEYLSQGITESIINSLSRLRELRVVPRSVVFRYKGGDVDPRAAGRELGVGAVLAGRVLQRGDTLIIGTELVDVASGWQLWGQRYNRTLSDIFVVEEEIAKEISERLRLRLTGEEEKHLAKRYTTSTEAYQDYLKGRYYWEKWTEEGWKKGIECFQQAIEKDPTYALAYVGLADSYIYLGWFSVLPPKEAYSRAKAAALKALEMDDSLAQAYNSLASVRMTYDWNWSDAEKEFKRAIELIPNYPTTHHWYAEYLNQMGRHNEALAEITRAQELDPRSLIINTSVGWQLYFGRQYDQAIKQYRMTLEMDPDFGPAHWGLGWTYVQKSMFEEAIAEFQKGISVSGGSPIYVAALGHALAVAHKTEKAEKVLEELKELSKRRYVPPYFIAAIYIGLGDKDQAFEWLEKAFQEHSSWLLYLQGEPRLDSLRSDPRFHDLLRRVGLPSQGLAWRAWSLRVGLVVLAAALSVTSFFVAPRIRPVVQAVVQRLRPTPGKIMLAVLPFANLSEDPNQEYFSDGLTEETIAQLGGLEPERLGVIARTSAMQYKGTNKRTDQIGRELGVDYILEASVRRAGGRVRITAQLIKTNDQTHVWAHSYERDMQDVLALEADVAQAIAQEIQIKLTAQEQVHLIKPRPVDAEAYEAYLNARYYWNRRDGAGLAQGIRYLEQAIQKDPNYALAYAQLAESYALLGGVTIGYDALPPRQAMPKAKDLAEKALKLDDSIVEAHTSLAYVKFTYDRDFQGAEKEFKRALELNAGYATAHQWYALYLSAVGRMNEAITHVERAQELDPLSEAINLTAAQVLIFARQYDRALEQCRKTLLQDPNSVLGYYYLGQAHEQMGNLTEALRAFESGKALSRGNPGMVMAVGQAYAFSGNRVEGQKALRELSAISGQRYVPALYFAAIYTGLGDKDQALCWVERGYEERVDYMVYLKREPMADSLRSEPRFQALIRRMGLPP